MPCGVTGRNSAYTDPVTSSSLSRAAGWCPAPYAAATPLKEWTEALGDVAGLFLGCVIAALTMKSLGEYGGPMGAGLLAPPVSAASLLQFLVGTIELAQR